MFKGNLFHKDGATTFILLLLLLFSYSQTWWWFYHAVGLPPNIETIRKPEVYILIEL